MYCICIKQIYEYLKIEFCEMEGDLTAKNWYELCWYMTHPHKFTWLFNCKGHDYTVTPREHQLYVFFMRSLPYSNLFPCNFINMTMNMKFIYRLCFVQIVNHTFTWRKNCHQVKPWLKYAPYYAIAY